MLWISGPKKKKETGFAELKDLFSYKNKSRNLRFVISVFNFLSESDVALRHLVVIPVRIHLNILISTGLLLQQLLHQMNALIKILILEFCYLIKT